MGGDPTNCRVAIFHAYYDASGTETTPDSLLAMAVLVATVEQWEAIEGDWRAVLKDCNVPYLHMKKFTASKGPFASGWEGNETKRAKFLGRLADTLHSRIEYARVFDSLPADFNAADEQYQLRESGYWSGPYAFVSSLCRDYVQRWFMASHPTDHIIHVFEDGDNGQGPLIAYARKMKVPLLVAPKTDPVTGEHNVAFQVADWVAYEHKLEASRVDAGKTHEVRRSLRAINDAIHPTKHFTIGYDVITQICRNHPDLYPPRSHGTGA